MRLIADNETCSANGMCAMVDEKMFPLDDDGYISIGDGVDIAPDQEAIAQDGVDACPVQALRLE